MNGSARGHLRPLPIAHHAVRLVAAPGHALDTLPVLEGDGAVTDAGQVGVQLAVERSQRGHEHGSLGGGVLSSVTSGA